MKKQVALFTALILLVLSFAGCSTSSTGTVSAAQQALNTYGPPLQTAQNVIAALGQDLALAVQTGVITSDKAAQVQKTLTAAQAIVTLAQQALTTYVSSPSASGLAGLQAQVANWEPLVESAVTTAQGLGFISTQHAQEIQMAIPLLQALLQSVTLATS
jgi:hypothetical protein